MRPIHLFLCLGFLFCFASLCAPMVAAEGPSPQQVSGAAAAPKMGNLGSHHVEGSVYPPGTVVYEFCGAHGVSAAGQRTIYYSAVFYESSDFKNRMKIVDTFRQFVIAKYSFTKDPAFAPDQVVTCIVPFADTPADVEKELQKYLHDPVRNVGQANVATGWTYTPPAEAAAPPPAHYAVCWAHNNPKVKYYSSVFDGSRDDARRWVPAFEKFLQQKYGFNGPAQCIADRPEPDAQKYLKTLLDQDRATRTMQGAPPQIVETGWKY